MSATSPDPAAGNLGTLTQQILDDTHMLVSQDRIWRKVCDAIRFHASNRLWFSEREFQFALTAGRASYAPGDGFGLPEDLQEIVGRKLFLHYQGATSQSEPMAWLSNEEFDERREWDETQGTPEVWTFKARRLLICPTPNNSTDVILGTYVNNIGQPRFRWTGSAYEFFTPDGQALTADWTSDWLQWDFGEQMIRNRVIYELLKSLRDPEADGYLAAWLEARTRLEEETDEKTVGGMDRLLPRLF